ncbi:MAG TPA: transposase [Ktedonobacteraceae bacterium]|nr:transposase [Ktedonobacteraceae bacterium]
MSIKAFKYRIYANKHTTEKLQWVLDRCRELYNAGLQERRDAYEMAVKRHPNYYDDEARKQLTREHAVGYYEQKRELVDIKELRPEYQEIASHVLQGVILRLKRAYDDFFRRVQNGEQPGYPRFQGRNRYDSFCYPDGAGWKLDAKERPADKKGIVRVNLRLSKIGTVKLHLHRTMEGTIKTLTIKVRRVSSSKRARQNVAGIVGISHVHLAYPCQTAEISKERGECSMLGGRQRRRELPTL